MNVRIMLVDDDIEMTAEIQKFLETEDYRIRTASNCSEAMEVFTEFRPDFVFLDLKLPDGSGLDLLEKMKDRSPETTVVMLSGYAAIPDSVQAMKQGAENFLTKPVDPEHLLLFLERLIEQKQLRNKVIIQELELADRRKFVAGSSKKMQDLLATCLAAAKSDTTLLITGETGTGKHLVAHYIHKSSKRAEYPLVYVNCATLSETLLESDLFGHERGAFTGALKQKRGRVELAHHGTLFLDEIGEVPPNLQAKLLHFIEYGEFQRVGGSETLRSNARIICATNRDLEKEVAAGNFRQDLFYRINVIQIHIPALRERPEDVPIFLDFFLEKFSRDLGRPTCKMDDSLREKLAEYSWPGNIRELQNSVERAVVLCGTNRLGMKDFPFLAAPAPSISEEYFKARPLQEALNHFKKAYIARLLEQNSGNQTQVAKILEIQRTYLNRLMKELDI